MFANTERYAIISEVRYVYITYYIQKGLGFTMAKSPNVYDASSITVLEGLEAVRKRPGMYIGSVSTKGLNHLIYEIVDNSVDEHLAGACTKIEVTLEADGSATISDNGRGIPVGMNHKAGKSALEVVYTVLHAGGKFGGGGYKVSGGLHGVGASVVNALSTWLEVEITRDGKVYKQRYEKGKVMYKLQVIGEAPEGVSGTKVTFLPDHTIFEDNIYDYDILSYAKMIVMATLVVRDMDAARFYRNGGKFTMSDRIDVARIFSKEVEHSEGNAQDLKEMCMMEEIAKVDALCRQI